MNTDTLAPWKGVQYTRNWNTCLETAPERVFESRPGNITGGVRYHTLNGESFSRDPGAPYKGNHIDALPYWSQTTSVNCPPWDCAVTLKYGVQKCTSFQYKGDGRYYTAILAEDFFHTPDPGTVELIQSLALTKATAALRKADASIPMMLRERKETVNMLKSYAGRGLALIKGRQLRDVERWKKFLKRKPTSNQRKKFAQSIADEHLMFIFGMMPLLSDIEGLCDYLTRPEYKVITGRGREARDFEDKSSKRMSYGFDTVTRRKHKISCNVSLRCDIEIEVAARARKLGFNPLYTVYDFTPLSFITGWFSNFNHFIQGLDPLVGLKYRTGSSSTRFSTDVERECYGSSSNQGELWHPGVASGNGKSFGNTTRTVRGVIEKMPTGSFHFYNNFSLFSVLASASLFVQRKVKLTHKAIKVKPFRYVSKRRPTLPPIKYTRT